MPSIFKSKHIDIMEPNPGDWIFCFERQEIFLVNENELPHFKDSPEIQDEKSYYSFGEIEGVNCLLIENSEKIKKNADFSLVALRQFMQTISPAFFSATLKGCHLAYWRRTHQYCGCCGTVLSDLQDEVARRCKNCSHITYPRISPCIIVLITRGEELLLARSSHFPAGIYSTLAGFIDPGESAEEAVHREIMEEVGISVKNVKYFSSQSWPFPDSLMLGFTAEYEEGEIKIDPKEIEDAKWYSPNNLPKLPNPLSISRALINSHLEKLYVDKRG